MAKYYHLLGDNTTHVSMWGESSRILIQATDNDRSTKGNRIGITMARPQTAAARPEIDSPKRIDAKSVAPFSRHSPSESKNGFSVGSTRAHIIARLRNTPSQQMIESPRNKHHTTAFMIQDEILDPEILASELS
jgi:hypothetical protein